MKRDKAMEMIDDLANVVSVEIPEKIEIDGRVYYIKDDIASGDRLSNFRKYEGLYEEVRSKIMEMDEVPDELVEKAIILRRVVIFLKDFKASDDIEDKKRWMEYIRRVKG